MQNISLLIVDDHTLILELVAQKLETNGGFDVKISSSFDDAKKQLRDKDKYDIVMLDIVLSHVLTLQDVKDIIKLNTSGHVVIFSGNVKDVFVQNCLDIGVSGFIPKTFSIDAVSSALRFIATGQKFVPAEFSKMYGDRAGIERFGIGLGEFDVLKKLAEGLSNKDITGILEIPETTVKMRVRSICQKLGAENRTQAVLVAQKNGLI